MEAILFQANLYHHTTLLMYHMEAQSIHTAITKSCAVAIHNGFQRVEIKFHRKQFQPVNQPKVNHCLLAVSITKEQLPRAKCNHRTAAATFHLPAKKWHSNRTKFWSPINNVHEHVAVPPKCQNNRITKGEMNLFALCMSQSVNGKI